VLGAVLMHNEALPMAAAVVGPFDFYRDAHRRIFDKMVRLAERGDAIDLVTLKEELGRSGDLEEVGGPAYITALVDGVPRSTNVEHYAQIIRNTARARTTMSVARDIIETVSRDPQALGNGAGSAFLTRVRELVEEAHADSGDGDLGQSADVFLSDSADAAPPLVRDFIPGVGIVLPHGHPRSRKSLITLHVLLSAALGESPFRLTRLLVTGPIASWYLTEEDHASELKKRLLEELAGRELQSPPATFRVSAQKGVSLDDPRTVDRVIREVSQNGIRLLAFDPVRAFSVAVDQGPNELQPLAKSLRRIIRETGVVILLPHHDTKPRQDGKADDRPRAHRASGGGIFSISEAPIHVERVSDDVTLLVPNMWKYQADPSPVKVRFERGPGWTRLVGEDVEAAQAASLAIHESVLSILTATPRIAGNAIVKKARVRREAVYQALEDLAVAGKVDSAKVGRATQWFIRGGA
jgi:hypothetical protein